MKTLPEQMAERLDTMLCAIRRGPAREGFCDGFRYWMQGRDGSKALIDRRTVHGKYWVSGYRAACACYIELTQPSVQHA